jgi:hypothetical protein
MCRLWPRHKPGAGPPRASRLAMYRVGENTATPPGCTPRPGTAGQRHYPELGTRSPLAAAEYQPDLLGT